MPTVVVEMDYCKGCGLCVVACPKHSMSLSDELSPRGYHFAQLDEGKPCTGCCACANVCPDAAIEVFGDARKEGAQR